MSQLLSQLGPSFRERTVRRWLSQLIESGLVEGIGEKRGRRYRYLEQKEKAGIFSKRSMVAIDYVHQSLFKRQPVSYHQEWLNQYRPNETVYLPAKTIQNLHQAGQRATAEAPAGTYARHIYNRLLIDLSYNSSRLEGNTYSLLDTERLLIEGESAEGKLNEETVMILNYKEAIRYLVEGTDKIDISETTICTLHYLLSDSLIEAKFAGKIRDKGVRIGGSTYTPYENPDIFKKLFYLICEKGSKIEDPFEQSLFLLIHLSYLQAFIDVNKRTARLSANIPLIRKNLVPLSFNEIEQNDYISAMLSIYELNDLYPIIDLFVDSYLRTCVLYNATVESIGFDKIRIQYRKERRAMIRQIIVHQLVGQKMRDYIGEEVKQVVKEEDRSAFLEDLEEDLNELAPQRIAGLGVTLDDLNTWLTLYRTQK